MTSWRIAANGFVCRGIGAAIAAAAMLPILVRGIGLPRLLLLGRVGRETLLAMFKRNNASSRGD
jgi:hypothetical protein